MAQHLRTTKHTYAACQSVNAQKVVRNLNAQQQAAFNNLPATYMQNAKQFVINKLAQSTILKS